MRLTLKWLRSCTGSLVVISDARGNHSNPSQKLKLLRILCVILQYIHSVSFFTGLEDDITVQEYLKDLIKEELRTLFRKLGLSPTRVENKYDKDLNEYRSDLVRSWIREDDKVREKGGATLENLRDALRSMDNIGIAENIPT